MYVQCSVCIVGSLPPPGAGQGQGRPHEAGSRGSRTRGTAGQERSGQKQGPDGTKEHRPGSLCPGD